MQETPKTIKAKEMALAELKKALGSQNPDAYSLTDKIHRNYLVALRDATDKATALGRELTALKNDMRYNQ